jgi:hypothetical protein
MCSVCAGCCDVTARLAQALPSKAAHIAVNAVAENGDQIALTPRLHPQYAEPVLRVVEGDALHQATEDLGRCAWLAGCPTSGQRAVGRN